MQDTGIGIPAETVQRLFSSFEQADNSITRKYGGSGLGLSITKKLAQLMGGESGVDSTPAVGSTFWFTAWLKKCDELPAVADFTAEESEEYVENQLILYFSHLRILLVDDEELNREFAAALLEDLQPQIEMASNGVEAVHLAARHPYDLILMDMQMPKMDGLEATRQIRRQPNGATVPIIALTGNTLKEEHELGYQAGINQICTKPIQPDRLFWAMLQLLSNQEP